jgi:hypothetical protein
VRKAKFRRADLRRAKIPEGDRCAVASRYTFGTPR